MNQLQITQRILECEENGWLDLLSKIDNITQNIMECPSAAFQIKAEMILWSDLVDMRSNNLQLDLTMAGECKFESSVMLHNPSMSHKEKFGTEV